MDCTKAQVVCADVFALPEDGPLLLDEGGRRRTHSTLSLEEPLQKPYANHEDPYIGTRTLYSGYGQEPYTLRLYGLIF